MFLARSVAVVDVIGVFPNVNGEERLLVVFIGRSASLLHDLQLAAVDASHAQPEPNCVAAAAVNCSELRVRLEVALDGLAPRPSARRRRWASCCSSRTCGSRPARRC